ncbi:DUF6682 family protein [Limnobacter sp.]|uniref:phage adaptor protein n=1 Tax=Limnobacter sp. TaxID=2003368 RepID=UPI0025C29042|nr:DUF6682 family protein [Limnobacter sp.]
MAVAVNDVIDKVQQILQDTAGIRWSETNELIEWVNDAQREITLLKPDATSTNQTVTLTTGTKQSLPSDGNRLLRVIRNMSAASGGNGGRSVRLVARDVLDTQTPTWHDPNVTGDAAHTNVVKNYIYDEQDPTNYYVFPGVSGDVYLEIVYSKNPAVVAAGDNLGVEDIYANAVQNYVLYMAYMKESEVAANAQRASSHYNLFTAAITGKAQIDTITTPNRERRGDS